jgi:hypothetical protein
VIRDSITCAVCGDTITAHYELFDHASCQAVAVPAGVKPDPRELLAKLQLQRVTQAVKSLQGRWPSRRRHRHGRR